MAGVLVERVGAILTVTAAFPLLAGEGQLLAKVPEGVLKEMLARVPWRLDSLRRERIQAQRHQGQFRPPLRTSCYPGVHAPLSRFT